MVNETNLPRVQLALPDTGLDDLMGRSWYPMLNFMMASPRQPEHSGGEGFPFYMMMLSPSSHEFLSSLGRPLAIARDLEASPGVWWLATPDGQHEYLISSDSHRAKTSWKGGQLCVLSKDPSPMNLDHPACKALQAGFEQVWGLPADDIMEEHANPMGGLLWFRERLQDAGTVLWPRAEKPGPALRGPR